METDPDCPIFMHVYIVLCVMFDVGRRFAYMWRGLDGPTFVHVYIFNSEGRGRKGRVLVDVERAGGPDCFMQVHTYFLIYTFISFFGSVAFCVLERIFDIADTVCSHERFGFAPNGQAHR